MDLLSLFRLIVRHWRVTVPAALLTLVGLVGALQLSSPTYQATGSIVLLSPPQPPEVDAATEDGAPPEAGQNPFARYGDLSVVADILVRVMDGDAKRAEFESQGVTGYEVVANRLQRGPVVEVTGKDSRSEGAIASADIVLENVNAVLATLQEVEHADPDYYITSAPLDPPSTATAMYGSTIRTAIAVMALGALGTLGIAVLAETFARRRAVRPTAAADSAMSDAASPETEGGASNGSRRAGWSAILPALRLAREESSKQELAWQKIDQQQEVSWQKIGEQPEPSKQKSAWQKSGQSEPSKQGLAWQKRGRQEPAVEESADQEPSKQGLAWRKYGQREPAVEESADQEPSKQEPAWQKTFQQQPSSEFPADNGHKRPTTDPGP